MKEYIEREAVLATLCKLCSFDKCDCPAIECIEYKQISNIPVADVAEVRHGEWIEGAEHFTNGFYEAECNKCGNYIRWNEGNSGEWNFCPNCGAKMDGKGGMRDDAANYG